MKVMVVEDDPSTRGILEAMLVKQGYSAILAASGEQAWEIFKSEDSLKLIILDIILPGMDGIELCKKIRSTNGRLPIYILAPPKNLWVLFDMI